MKDLNEWQLVEKGVIKHQDYPIFVETEITNSDSVWYYLIFDDGEIRIKHSIYTTIDSAKKDLPDFLVMLKEMGYIE